MITLFVFLTCNITVSFLKYFPIQISFHNFIVLYLRRRRRTPNRGELRLSNLSLSLIVYMNCAASVALQPFNISSFLNGGTWISSGDEMHFFQSTCWPFIGVAE